MLGRFSSSAELVRRTVGRPVRATGLCGLWLCDRRRLGEASASAAPTELLTLWSSESLFLRVESRLRIEPILEDMVYVERGFGGRYSAWIRRCAWQKRRKASAAKMNVPALFGVWLFQRSIMRSRALLSTQ